MRLINIEPFETEKDVGTCQIQRWRCGDGYQSVEVTPTKDIPTIDAVAVVRCGECKEYRNGDCYHPLAYGMGSMLRGLEPTDFCSCGERKE